MRRPTRAAAAALLALALALPTGSAQEPLVVRVGISLPLTGAARTTTGPILDGALLGLASAATAGLRIEPVILDYAVDGAPDATQGARDLAAFVADPAVLAVIGPYNSSVAIAQIPVGNAAGLLQCSPSATSPELTKGDAGRALRTAAPDRTAFIRTATTDDVQAPAMARYAMETLGIRRVAILDDTQLYGRGAADAFARTWEALGGTVTGREGVAPEAGDYAPALARLAAGVPEALYFGGLPSTGAAAVRVAMAEAGLGALPFLVGEGANDGDATTPGTFLAAAGPAAGEVWTTEAAAYDYPGRAAFSAAYMDAYGTAPTAYATTAYACAQIVTAALAAALGAGSPDRETVRALATDPSRTWTTILGPTSFDPRGDIRERTIAFYRHDPVAGPGAFTFVEQITTQEETP